MKRIYHKIQSFVTGSSVLNGTIGLPVSIPWYLRAIANKLDDTMIANLGHYIVVPYSANYLRAEAMTDWLFVCKDRD